MSGGPCTGDRDRISVFCAQFAGSPGWLCSSLQHGAEYSETDHLRTEGTYQPVEGCVVNKPIHHII